jgi:hypothetical protein
VRLVRMKSISAVAFLPVRSVLASVALSVRSHIAPFSLSVCLCLFVCCRLSMFPWARCPSVLLALSVLFVGTVRVRAVCVPRHLNCFSDESRSCRSRHRFRLEQRLFVVVVCPEVPCVGPWSFLSCPSGPSFLMYFFDSGLYDFFGSLLAR